MLLAGALRMVTRISALLLRDLLLHSERIRRTPV